jgi:hypothetical protein
MPMDLQMALAKGRLAVPLKIFMSQLCFGLKQKNRRYRRGNCEMTLTTNAFGARVIWGLAANPPAAHNQIILVKHAA